jgi:hypothetical protein
VQYERGKNDNLGSNGNVRLEQRTMRELEKESGESGAT